MKKNKEEYIEKHYEVNSINLSILDNIFFKSYDDLISFVMDISRYYIFHTFSDDDYFYYVDFKSSFYCYCKKEDDKSIKKAGKNV